jgi:hypothetical protein
MPGLAAVEAQVHAVVAADHPPGIERVDPEIVMVAVVEAPRLLERLAPVDALEHRHARAPERVRIAGIDDDRRVVPGPLPQRVRAILEQDRERAGHLGTLGTLGAA